MKKSIFALVVVALMTLLAPHAKAADAQVLKDVGCFISPGASGLPIFLTTTQTIDVATSGNVVSLTCHFSIPEGYEPKQAIQNAGFLCSVIGLGPVTVLTTNSFSVATPGGQALLRCQVKNTHLTGQP